MNGAQALLETLIACGIDTCFANPGTSEMHLVSAIGGNAAMRPVLCLFEGVATGAADGYARITDRPAITLLHLGPGLANGMANLHNARKAHVPLVNIVGDHAPYHLPYDAPLTTDVPAYAALASHWQRSATSATDLALAGAEAVRYARTGAGKIATVIAPANFAWEQASGSATPLAVAPRPTVAVEQIEYVAKCLRKDVPTALVLGGRALRRDSLARAGRIAAATGAHLLSETFPARLARGAGCVATERIPYFAEHATEFLAPYKQLIIVASQDPAAFFAYPGLPSRLAPEDCETISCADVDDDIDAALDAVLSMLPARDGAVQARQPLDQPRGALTTAAIGATFSRCLPEHALVSDEGITAGLDVFRATSGAAPHEWLAITGGAIGQGLPVSLGLALGAPERKVVALQADGSAMYTVQSLWSMAREQCDITIVLINNASYAVLNIELARLDAGAANAKTRAMLEIDKPELDWVQLASGMGIPATRVDSAEAFEREFSTAMQTPGPRLIEAIVASVN